MSKLPQTGLYISEETGSRLYVRNAFGEDPEEFYLVEVIDEASKADPMAMGDELDKNQWESLIKEHGLVYQG